MANRYFKATNGIITVFRASAIKVYRSAFIGEHGASFSATMSPANAPAVEITKAEFAGLTAIKNARIIATRGDLRYVPPSDSWVNNSELPA